MAHPIEGASVTLLLGVENASETESVVTAVQTAGGTVEAELPFETLAVSVVHDDVEAICAIEGVESVETEDTLTMAVDGAGEDVD